MHPTSYLPLITVIDEALWNKENENHEAYFQSLIFAPQKSIETERSPIMKKQLQFCLLLVFMTGLLLGLTPARAQNGYMPFFPDTAMEYAIGYFPIVCKKEYNPYLVNMCTGIYNSNSGDTAIVNGKRYRVFNGNYHVREDTLYGRIYRYYPDLDSEFVFCDMSLQEGDTFHFPVLLDNVIPHVKEHYYFESDSKTVVDSVRWIKGRKVIFLHYLSFSGTFVEPFYNENEDAYYHALLRFVEGVGPAYGPLGFIEDLFADNSLGLLFCLHYGDSLVYMTHPDVGCYQNVSSLNPYEKKVITAYPNPTRGMLYVTAEKENDEGHITITDMAGMVVMSMNFKGKTMRLDVSHLPAGVYLLCYTDKEGKAVKKFVKQ